MTRQKIEIKKIDNIAARQVAFSKRKRGILKKAQELSTLCDAEVALIVFSATGKVFEYASSSMLQVVERYSLRSDIDRLHQPSIELQVGDTYNMMRKEMADKTHELRQLMGEELQGLKFQELKKLEQRLGKGLACVSKAKDERIAKEIAALKRKGIELMQENRRLKQETDEQGKSSKSIMICNPSDRAQDSDNYYTSLNIGLPLFK